MGAIFYGNLNDEIRSTENDWYDDEEFEELNVDSKKFEIEINVSSGLDLRTVSNVFISFFDRKEPKSKLESIGQLNNYFFNGKIYQINNKVIWFRLSSLERLPSRSFTSKLIDKLCNELFTKILINDQSIYLLIQQPSYDHQFEYFTNQQTDDLKEYQLKLPIMFTKASDGLLFENCIKNQRKIHVLKLPLIEFDQINGLKQFLPDQLYREIQFDNNYLITSSNLYA